MTLGISEMPLMTISLSDDTIYSIYLSLDRQGFQLQFQSCAEEHDLKTVIILLATWPKFSHGSNLQTQTIAGLYFIIFQQHLKMFACLWP